MKSGFKGCRSIKLKSYYKAKRTNKERHPVKLCTTCHRTWEENSASEVSYHTWVPTLGLERRKCPECSGDK